MSEVNTEENVLSETIVEQVNCGNLKLVPVAESIRYRRRAQSAEKEVESLSEQLAKAKTEISEMTKQVDSVKFEQALSGKLVAAGTVDLEGAVLIAKGRLKGSDEVDLDACVEQLKKDKQYLFNSAGKSVLTAQRTTGAKDRVQNNQTVLAKSAKKAATTGSRADLQEYLKLRRNFV